MARIELSPGVYRMTVAFARPPASEEALAKALGRLGFSDVAFDALPPSADRVGAGLSALSTSATTRYAPLPSSPLTTTPTTTSAAPVTSSAPLPSLATAAAVPPPPKPPPLPSLATAASAPVTNAVELPKPPPMPSLSTAAAVKVSVDVPKPRFGPLGGGSSAPTSTPSPAATAAASQASQAGQPYTDPATGYVYDPATGRWRDPKTGATYDIKTGQWYDAQGNPMSGSPANGGGSSPGGSSDYVPPNYGAPGLGDLDASASPDQAPEPPPPPSAKRPDGVPRSCKNVSEDGKVWLCPPSAKIGAVAALPFAYTFVGKLVHASSLETSSAFEVRSVERLSIDPFQGLIKAAKHFPIEQSVRYDLRIFSRDKTAATRGDVSTLLEAMGWALGALMLVRRNVRIPSRPNVSVSEWIATGTWTLPDTLTVEHDPFFFLDVAPAVQQP